jgi:hypothetical protein
MDVEHALRVAEERRDRTHAIIPSMAGAPIELTVDGSRAVRVSAPGDDPSESTRPGSRDGVGGEPPRMQPSRARSEA